MLNVVRFEPGSFVRDDSAGGPHVRAGACSNSLAAGGELNYPAPR
jgi:hypothetical protein